MHKVFEVSRYISAIYRGCLLVKSVEVRSQLKSGARHGQVAALAATRPHFGNQNFSEKQTNEHGHGMESFTSVSLLNQMRDLKKNVNFLILTDSFGNTTSYNGH